MCAVAYRPHVVPRAAAEFLRDERDVLAVGVDEKAAARHDEKDLELALRGDDADAAYEYRGFSEGHRFAVEGARSFCASFLPSSCTSFLRPARPVPRSRAICCVHRGLSG